MDQSRSTASRGISFSVESLIAKPEHLSATERPEDSSARTSGLPAISFSVERLLHKQDIGGEDVKKRDTLKDVKETEEGERHWQDDFPWMHSTRYDPPPRKLKLEFSLIFQRKFSWATQNELNCFTFFPHLCHFFSFTTKWTCLYLYVTA